MKGKQFCIDCGREINHRGRCLACNKKAKEKMTAQDKFVKKQK